MDLARGLALVACITLGSIEATAGETCNADDADRARNALNRYLGDNPDKRMKANELYQRIIQQMGGDIKPGQTCEAVARMMAELKRTG